MIKSYKRPYLIYTKMEPLSILKEWQYLSRHCSEVVGSNNPTLSIFSCYRTTALIFQLIVGSFWTKSLAYTIFLQSGSGSCYPAKTTFTC
jgi:hypothetical protein